MDKKDDKTGEDAAKQSSGGITIIIAGNENQVAGRDIETMKLRFARIVNKYLVVSIFSYIGHKNLVKKFMHKINFKTRNFMR